MEKSERDEILKELKLLEVLLNAYNSSSELMNRPGAAEYIDSVLDRISELRKKLNNNPS